MTNENLQVSWLHMPRLPFDVIMSKIAHNSLTDLRSCSRVCSLKNSAGWESSLDFPVPFPC